MEKQDLKTLLENIYALLINEAPPPLPPPTEPSIGGKFMKSLPPSTMAALSSGGPPPQGPPPLPPNAPNWPFQGQWPAGTTTILQPAGIPVPAGAPAGGLFLNIPGGNNPWYVVMPQGPSFMWAGSSWIPFG